MRNLVKIGLILCLTAVLLFCTIGFLATFEPNPPASQWTWRLTYSAVALLSTLGSVVLWKVISSSPA
jgi:hypothetical protein